MRSKLLVLNFIFLVWCSANAQVGPLTVSPEKIRAVELRTSGDKPFSLTLKKPAVLVFLSPECPLSKNYAPVLSSLAKAHPSVQFYGVFPGKAYTLKEIRAYGTEYSLNFPLLLDPAKQLTRYTKATVTPEVVFLSPQGRVLYSGKIDNWAVSLGKQRQVITEHYLKDAFRQWESGKQITISRTDPVGCLINDI